VKPKKQAKAGKYPADKSQPATLREAAVAYQTDQSLEEGPMIRTQIYLSRPEHEFVQTEASRRGEPMAAVIRAFVEEKMRVPDDAWINNPMLHPVPDEPEWQGHEDGAINHDHYLYGGPKKWLKQNGQWVEAPPLPDDYFDNPASANAYDEQIRKLEEEERKR
jgi:hypothetical protein